MVYGWSIQSVMTSSKCYVVSQAVFFVKLGLHVFSLFYDLQIKLLKLDAS